MTKITTEEKLNALKLFMEKISQDELAEINKKVCEQTHGSHIFLSDLVLNDNTTDTEDNGHLEEV